MTAILHKYLSKHTVDADRLPQDDFIPQIIVVIPCYDEPQLVLTLESISNAESSDLRITVIVVVNSGERSSQNIIDRNKQTYEWCLEYASRCNDNIRLLPLLYEQIRHKHAGAGYARQLGMDMAVALFARYDVSDGVIASLDADTLVATNYFTAIAQCFAQNKGLYGAVIRFEHPLNTAIDPQIVEAIAHYELHLRYVNLSLKYCGFPYAHHTVGSAFTVSAMAYAKHGGMNRHKGGEDFYFLHKLFPHGHFIELNETCVYPASRTSSRVPFGTGPQVSAFLLSRSLSTYQFQAFLDLKVLFENMTHFQTSESWPELPRSISDFLIEIDLDSHLREIRTNVGSQSAFVKRFYQYFDAFMVVKYLNFSHQHHYIKQDIKQEANLLLEVIGDSTSPIAMDLLLTYRKIESK